MSWPRRAGIPLIGLLRHGGDRRGRTHRRHLPAIALLLPLAAQADTVDGRALFAGQCALCHQAGAGGVPGQFPPLRGRIDRIAATQAGAHYLAEVLLNGMAGPIVADGGRYVGDMPSFRQLTDAQIAAVLAYLAGLGTPGAPGPDAATVAAARATPQTPTQVLGERDALAAAHALP